MMVPFQGRSLVLQNGTRIFPSHAPLNDAVDTFVHAPETPRTHADLTHKIRSQHNDVATVCTITLQMTAPNPNNTADHWFPLQGGQRTRISKQEIDRVCECIESETADAVLLHCYHGLNRTLLVLAAVYLRQELSRGYRRTVEDALHCVRSIRPPGIVRGQTVDALKSWWRRLN